MYFKFNKIILVLTILFLLFLMPSCFADDGINETDIIYDNYYVNASFENDGNGSVDNPYNELTNDNIKDNSNFYFANGEYTFTPMREYTNISFYGEDGHNTVIDGNGGLLTINGQFILNNITLSNFRIFNQGNVIASNTIFTHSDSIGGVDYGGVIYVPDSLRNIYLVNCTFINNHAQYGGAIYMNGGILEINDSIFINNTANFWGGAIVCGDNTNITINNTSFIDSKAVNDAGGALYIKSSIFRGDNLNISNSSATFGGAITSLNSQINLTNFIGYNNHANYEGGAIYHLYGNFSIYNSRLINNTARNGAGLFVDDSKYCYIILNTFINNTAINYAGAVYSLYNNLSLQDNQYLNNNASFYNDLYNTSSLDVIITSGNYTMYVINATGGELPSSYSSFSEGYVTSVKNQGSGGNCWAFAALATLESCILKASGDNLDLSEENVKNLISLYSDWGWNKLTNDGGYDDMAIGYLLGWLGPIYESDDVYHPLSLLSPLLDSIMHVQNVVFFKRENYTDNDAIKRAIMDYGAVATSLYMASTTKQYYDGDDNVNHAVAIVGWNDTLEIPNAPAPGAWICKNSWGSNWGDNGYFYVSYYDTKFARVNVSDVTYTFILNDTLKLDKNYQYDVAGRTDYFFVDADKIWYKNIFNATDNELITAVSTYFEKTANWTFTIYVNGEIKLIQSGISNSGYYTFNLDNFIPLNIGDVFEVVFNVGFDGDASFPISEIVSLNKLTYSENTSFFSFDGLNWFDLFNYTHEYPGHTYDSQVACIKVFTSLDYIINSTVNLNLIFINDNIVKIKADVYDQYGNIAKQGNVTFTIEGNQYCIDLINGTACIIYNFTNIGVNTVDALFNGEVYNSSSDSSLIDLSNITVNPSIIIKNTDYSDDLIAEIVLNDEKGNFISANVSLVINNHTYSFAVDDGNISFKVPIILPVGEYDAYLVNNGVNVNFDNLSCKFNISKLDVYFDFDFVYDLNNVLINILPSKDINETLTINVFEKNFTVDFIDNKYSLNLTNLDYGIYPISVYLNDNYNLFNNSDKFNISILKTNILLPNDFVAYYMGDNVLSVRLIDVNNENVSDREIIFKINNNTYNVTTNEFGLASISISLINGKYDMCVTFSGDESYLSQTNNTTFVVNSTIIIPNSVKYAQNSIYQIRLLDKNGNALSNKKVNISIGGKTYVKTTDGNAFIVLTLDLTPKTYKLTIINLENNEKITQDITIVSRITGNKDITLYYGLKYNYKVRIYNDNGKVASKVKVTFNVNGKTYTKTTDKNGYATLLINKNHGKYTVKITYNGFTVTNKVTVKPTIITKDITKKKSKKIKFSAKLVNTKGKILKGKKITFKVKGKKYTAKTNKKGIAVITIKNLKVGKYKIISSYTSEKITNIITIKK